MGLARVRTREVTLTREKNDYGADVLACGEAAGRIVAQCKHWRGKVSAAQVRELAGSVVFFGAQQGFLFCLQKPDDERDQCTLHSMKSNLGGVRLKRTSFAHRG